MASLTSEADTSTPGRRSVDALRNELPSFGAEAAGAGHGDDENADSVGRAVDDSEEADE